MPIQNITYPCSSNRQSSNKRTAEIFVYTILSLYYATLLVHPAPQLQLLI